MHSFACFCDNTDGLAIVIAFDPGGTTGYCVMGVEPNTLARPSMHALCASLAHIEYGEIDCGTRHGQTGVGMRRGHDGMNMPGEIDGIVRMINVVDQYNLPAVALEDFVLDVRQANMGRDLLTPVRVIAGFTTLMQYSFGEAAMKSVFIQNRSPVKTTCTDDRLKNWKLYDRNSGPHARDAVRHAYYFLRTCRGDTNDAALKRHLAWPHLFGDPAIAVRKTKPKTQVGQRITSLG